MTSAGVATHPVPWASRLKKDEVLVSGLVSRPVVTIIPEMPVRDAFMLMQQEELQRVLVINAHGDLVGMVSASDLLHACWAEAALPVAGDFLSRIDESLTVGEVMRRDVVAVPEQLPVEQLAAIMAERKIECVPVVHEGRIVGLVTAFDLLDGLLALVGVDRAGVRFVADMAATPEALARLLESIFDAGGDIVAMSTLPGATASERVIMTKVEGLTPGALRQAIEPHLKEIIEIEAWTKTT